MDDMKIDLYTALCVYESGSGGFRIRSHPLHRPGEGLSRKWERSVELKNKMPGMVECKMFDD